MNPSIYSQMWNFFMLEGLRRRFHELYKGRKHKHKHRNELVFLLGELLQKDGINREEYK